MKFKHTITITEALSHDCEAITGSPLNAAMMLRLISIGLNRLRALQKDTANRKARRAAIKAGHPENAPKVRVYANMGVPEATKAEIRAALPFAAPKPPPKGINHDHPEKKEED